MSKRGWGVFVLIMLACLAFVWLIKAPILSAYFSSKMGVKVSARSISIWPSTMKIKNFKIHNPKGYKDRTAFQADSIRLFYSWSELTGDPNVIDEIVIENANLDIELDDPTGRSNNWATIIQNMPASPGPDHHFIVKKLVLKNLKVKISGLGLMGSEQTKTIEEMELYNIDSRKGFPTSELIEEIFSKAGLMQFIEHIIPGGGVLKILPFGAKKEAGKLIPDLSIS